MMQYILWDLVNPDTLGSSKYHPNFKSSGLTGPRCIDDNPACSQRLASGYWSILISEVQVNAVWLYLKLTFNCLPVPSPACFINLLKCCHLFQVCIARSISMNVEAIRVRMAEDVMIRLRATNASVPLATQGPTVNTQVSFISISYCSFHVPFQIW